MIRNVKDDVFDKLFKIGFEQTYINRVMALFDKDQWRRLTGEDAYLSEDHIIDDLVDLIDEISPNIDHVLLNIRESERAEYKRITDDIREHYSTLHLVQIIIDFANGKYNPISTNKFLYNPTHVSDWYDYNDTYHYYNAVDKNDVYKAIDDLNVERTYELYYHATNWDGIQNILKYGPKYLKGRLCLDFGIKESFYLTPDVDMAIEWACKERFMFEGGIVVFALRLSQYRNRKEFSSANAQWKALVKSSRQCLVKENELDEFDFVFGPMLNNSTPYHPTKWQLASKNEVSDGILKENMIGAIIFKNKYKK